MLQAQVVEVIEPVVDEGSISLIIFFERTREN